MCKKILDFFEKLLTNSETRAIIIPTYKVGRKLNKEVRYDDV